MGILSRTVLILVLFQPVLNLVLIQPTPGFAQGITTAALYGRILDDTGAPLPDATVVALHEPTGVSSGVFSRADGRYNIAGLRTGGPYEIRVSYIGYRTAVRQDILLTMGQSLRADFRLDREIIEAGEITVTAHRDEVLNASNTGTETHVSAIEIARLPSIARSIQDYTRLAPEAASKAGGQSIAGKNNRLNNFQVDGAVLNDAFGLTGEGLPTGQVDAQPISLDAIEEFQVQVAPFDVRSGGFAGGLINAVTRSGTNRFRGSLYWFGRNESLVGDLDGDEFGDFTDYQLGFRLGGPVARNRAFFFVNGELRRRSSPSSAGPADSDQPIRFGAGSADLQRIVDIARERYGYDAGGFDPFSQDTRNEKIFARLDVNLSPGHRLTLRHNLVNGDLDDGLSRGRTLFTLTSNQFKRDNVTQSSVVQLNSTFSGSLANEARISYSRVRDKRSPLSASFPQVRIGLEEPGGAFLGEVRLGVERFSQANTLDQDTFEFTNDLHLFRADHTITIGTHNEFVSFDNLFIQDYYGAYEFDSIEAFEQGTPARYLLSRSSVPGVEQPRAAWDYVQLGFYAQDAWRVSPRLSLNFGLRADVPILPVEPLANDRFARQFAGYRTDRTPGGQVLWSPRFGFNIDAGGDRGTQIRGGAGVFAGLPPAVWLSNAYSNTGVDFTRIDLATFRDQDVPAFVADPFAQPLPLDAQSLCASDHGGQRHRSGVPAAPGLPHQPRPRSSAAPGPGRYCGSPAGPEPRRRTVPQPQYRGWRHADGRDTGRTARLRRQEGQRRFHQRHSPGEHEQGPPVQPDAAVAQGAEHAFPSRTLRQPCLRVPGRGRHQQRQVEPRHLELAVQRDRRPQRRDDRHFRFRSPAPGPGQRFLEVRDRPGARHDGLRLLRRQCGRSVQLHVCRRRERRRHPGQRPRLHPREQERRERGGHRRRVAGDRRLHRFRSHAARGPRRHRPAQREPFAVAEPAGPSPDPATALRTEPALRTDAGRAEPGQPGQQRLGSEPLRAV